MTLSRVFLNTVVVVSTASGALGCSQATRLASGDDFDDLQVCVQPAATVYITNDNWLDMAIFILRSGSRYRLGQVSSLTSSVFELPETIIGAARDLQVVADPIGSNRGWSSPLITIVPGHNIIDVRLSNVINHSTYYVGVEDPADLD